VAALRSGKTAEAHIMLQQLSDQHPGWPNRNEAIYLQANIAFEKGEYQKALSALALITPGQLLNEQRMMKNHYLAKVTNRTTLDYLHRQFPQDKEVASSLANLIKTTYTPADKPLLDALIKENSLDPKLYQTTTASTLKSSYRIGVLLPFSLETLAYESKPKNKFVLDLYQGMRYAADSLSKKGVKLELFAYDAGTDSAAMKRVLQQAELQSMDVLIGPVYKSGARPLARFATQYKIPVINPLSEDGELLKQSPYVFLAGISQQMKASQLAQFTFANIVPATAVIIHENNREDSLFARLYQQEFTKLGGEVKAYQNVSGRKSGSSMSQITSLDLTEVGHVVVAGESPTIAGNVISLLDSKKYMQPVFVPESWLNLATISLEQLDEREFFFISPNFLDSSKPGVRTFRKGYTFRNHIPPSEYAIRGFELTFFLGQILRQYGADLTVQLPKSGYLEGALLPGKDFSQANASRFVPLYKLEQGELMPANSPTDIRSLIPIPTAIPSDDK
jgi:ABC-type branched-subunit amino acid transport system substrate-binding protein